MSGKIIFILGAPRSGTTILQRKILSSKNIISYPETWFFATHLERMIYSYGISKIGYRGSTKGLRNFLKHNKLEKAYLKSLRRTYLDLTQNKAQFQYVLEKTPANILMWEKIVSLCEKEDKLILIERAPKEIYLSMLNHFDKPPFLKNVKIFYDLKNYLREIDNFKLNNSDYLSIHYNDLINNETEIDLELQKYLNLKDIRGIGDLKDYEDVKTHGDKTARDSKKIKKVHKSKSKLANKIAACIFENKFSLSAYVMIFIGYLILILNGRTKKKGTLIYF